MDRNGNGEEFLMNKVLNNVCDGLSFRHFDKELFTGNSDGIILIFSYIKADFATYFLLDLYLSTLIPRIPYALLASCCVRLLVYRYNGAVGFI